MRDDEGGAGLRAPALEKGLEILEMLATERSGLLQKDVASRVGRSVNEIFRVLGVLERRGYISRDKVTSRYSLTLKLFELGNIHPPTRRLVEIAIPLMEEFATATGCSCHLVIRHHDRLMVIAHAQPDSQLMGWSVKVGGVFDMAAGYASARMIAAYQRDDVRRKLATLMLDRTVASAPELEMRLSAIRAAGYEIHQSGIAPGVTDISCAILNHAGEALAALTAPVVNGLTPPERQQSQVLPQLRAVADAISRKVGAPDVAG